MRHWREIKGLSQADLAAAAGMPDYKLCRIELGQTELRAREAELIAVALNLSMGEFYGEPGAAA